MVEINNWNGAFLPDDDGQPDELTELHEMLRELIEVAGWYGTLYRDVMKVTPSYFDKCADAEAARYLYAEAEASIKRANELLGTFGGVE